MTSPTPPSRRATAPRSRLRLFAGVALVAVLAAAAFGAWYAFLRPVPAAVSLGAAVPSAPATGDPGAGASSAPTVGAGSAGRPASTVEGVWTVDPSIGSFSDFTGSFVGYRVQEVLAQIGSTTAVGRTPDVTGTLTIAGTTLAAVEIEADLTSLQSDSGIRDGQLGRQGLETDRYPTGRFVLTEPIELGTIPAEGAPISVTAIGELTLHGTTNVVQIPLQAQLDNGVITVVGSLEVVFGDYGMTAPSAARVLEIDDHGIMELQLHFTRR